MEILSADLLESKLNQIGLLSLSGMQYRKITKHMQRHKRRGNGDRSFQPGKGSAERGSEWRKYYDGIAWPDGGRRIESDGFIRSGARLVKRYGQSEPEKDDTSAAVVIH